MVTTNEVEVLEKSAVKVKVTVPGTEIKKEYDKLVNDYCKTVQIKGFRKGKIPANVLVRKFGDAIKEETTQNVLHKSLEDVLEKVEQKPLPYSQPQLVDEEKLKEFDLEKDFTFEITYDTFPKVELGEYSNLEIEEPEVEITDEDLERELKAIQEQNALVVEKKDPVVAKDDVVTMDYIELDEEDKDKEDSKREGFTFTVGSGYNLYELDEDIIGMKKDEEKVITKKYADDFKHESLKGKEIKIKVKITNVKVKDLPELDDDLAQDVSEKYETLDDLKADIKKRLEDTKENKVKEDKVSQLLEQVVKNSTMELPESMVQQELAAKWQQMLYRFGANEQHLLNALEGEQKTRDNLFEQWRPATEEGIKSSLAVEEMAKKEKIEISDDEVEEELKKLAEAQNQGLDEIKEQITKNNMMESLKINIRHQKLFTQILKNSKINKGKKYNYLDFVQGKKESKDEE